MIFNFPIVIELLISLKIHLIIIFSFILVFWNNNFSTVYADIQFEDVTELSGLIYFGESYGSSWGDFNGDGWPDLWTGNHGPFGKGSTLYLNNADGTFTTVKQNLGFEDLSNHDIHTGSWADFDNDGDQDLMVVAGAKGGDGEGPNFFMINNGGVFKDNAENLGLDFPLGRGRIPIWFDWNNDGFLDILLVNHPRPDGKAPTTLFIQKESGFEKIAAFDKIESADTAQISYLFGNSTMNLIFLNPSAYAIYKLDEASFNNILSDLNVKKFGSVDMIISDLNGDLLPDILRVRGGLTANPFQNDILQLNNDDGIFDETRSEFQVPTSCIGGVGGDFDNDMDIDIFMVCGIWGRPDAKGEEYSSDENLPNILYENSGNANFIKVQHAGGAEGSKIGVGETVSVADFDNDGFLDLFITNGGGWKDIRTGGPHQLFRNIGNDNNWIELFLVGTLSNRDGIGTRIIITAEGTTQFREQTGGIHFRSQDHQRIHFGLGDNDEIDKIIVFWPSGIVHSIENVPANQILEINEPMTPLSPRYQEKLGLESSKVMCKNGLELVMKTSTKKAACVTSLTAEQLIKRNWGIMNDNV